jgi:hypothetical protein
MRQVTVSSEELQRDCQLNVMKEQKMISSDKMNPYFPILLISGASLQVAAWAQTSSLQVANLDCITSR